MPPPPVPPIIQKRYGFGPSGIGGGRIVAVKPRPAVMPLVAVTVGHKQDKDWRSRPGSEPGLRVLAGIAIEGLEDLADIANGVA